LKGENTVEKGQIVTIYNQTLSGEKIVEGKAKLIKQIKGNYWEVEFINEKGECYQRFIEA